MLENCNIIKVGPKESMIDKIADHLMRSRSVLSRTAVIFGGKRPALFLRKELAERHGRAYVPPVIFSVNEFMGYILSQDRRFARLTGFDAAYAVYSIVKRRVPVLLRQYHGFSGFLTWASEISGFIDAVDSQMIDDSMLMSVAANAEMGFDVQESVNRLLSDIVFIRKEYHEYQENEGRLSRGMVHSLAAGCMDAGRIKDFDSVVFCDITREDKSFLSVVNAVCSAGKGLVFQSDVSAADCVDVDIEYIPSGRTQSQAASVAEVIANIENLDDTVIVMPSADGLVPLLSQLSAGVSKYNVSMGYPVARSSLYCLLKAVSKAQMSRRGQYYYAKDYIKVCNDPIVKNLRIIEHENSAAVTRVIMHRLQEFLKGKFPNPCAGNAFVSLENILAMDDLFSSSSDTLSEMGTDVSAEILKKLFHSIHDMLFAGWQCLLTPAEYAGALCLLIDNFLNRANAVRYPLNLKAALHILELAEQWKTSKFADEIFSEHELFTVFDELLSRERVSFAGTPLDGLQVLGLMETRSLNFKNVLVFELEENRFPSVSKQEPLIPDEVLRMLGMSRYRREIDIQKHHFMRLIASADKAFLFYSSQADSQPSRFIEDIIWHKEKKQGSLIRINRSSRDFQAECTKVRKKADKTQKMLDYLKKYSYSASAIKTYQRCPMCFYYKYVLGLREDEDLLEDPDGRDIGNFLHKLLEDIYAPFVGRNIKVDDKFVKQAMSIFDSAFDREFAQRLGAQAFMLKTIMTYRLKCFFDAEIRRSPFKIIAVEEKITSTLELGSVVVNSGAKIDRIDSKDGVLYVIDYKTGELDITDLQLPLYLMLTAEKYPEYKIQNAFLYSLKTAEQKYLYENVNPETVIRTVLSHRQQIAEVIQRIQDPELPFEPGCDMPDDHKCV